ncbi:MAG: hypothetical protein RL375_3638 [Pseudomonadota bacterium]|jgi:hypothetical protein
MSMKKTDLEKRLAKKLDGRMKSGAVPQRFGKGAAAAVAAKDKPAEAARPPVAKLVPVSCRLPAELVTRLREQALLVDGGMSAVVTQAVEQWLATAGKTTPA